MGQFWSGETQLKLWFFGFLAAGLIAGIVSGFFKARKIQPRGLSGRPSAPRR